MDAIKKTKPKRLISMLLALCMVLTLLPVTALAADGDAMTLGASSIPKGNFIYYGNYGSENIKWKVLSDEGNGGTYQDSGAALFLLSEYILDNSSVQFDKDGTANGGQTNPNEWQHSDAQNWCSTFINSAFDEKEAAAIHKTSKTDNETNQYSMRWVASSLNEEQVFFISADEAATYIGSQNGADGLAATTSAGGTGVWWLRSPYEIYHILAGAVTIDGYVYGHNVFGDWAGRPAFNLNLDSVLFASAAEGGKSATVGSTLTPVTTYGGDEWKLTLKDTTRNGFDASFSAKTETKLFIEYTGAQTGSDEYISAIIKDSSGNITHYGRLKNTTAVADASGTVNIDLSGVAMATTDKLYVFSEQYNGGANDDTKRTDYASKLVEVSHTKNAYAITNNLTNISTDNAAVYRLMSNTDDYTATLTADTNYTLPATITVKVGDTPLAVGTDYTYSGGILTIPAVSITGDIAITAAGVAPHAHSWTTAWTSDSTHHWHECETAGCTVTDNSAKDGYGAHTASDWIIDTNATASTNGSKHKECTACGYVMETAVIPATGGTGGGSGSSTDYYTLTFDTGGGSDITSTRISEYTTVDLTLSKYIPTYEGHEFTGWYADESLTDKITSIRLTKNTTIYAGWKLTHENPQTGMGNPFTDVKESDWFFEDVMFVYGNKLMVGTSDTTFSPNAPTTRGMIVTILHRLEGTPASAGANTFKDVENGKWYTDAVTWAKENGIVSGYSENSFGPNDQITREQMGAIMYNYAKFKGSDVAVNGDLSKFGDASSVSGWAKEAMTWAVENGIFNGMGDNTLSPSSNATRAQVAAIMDRYLNK